MGQIFIKSKRLNDISNCQNAIEYVLLWDYKALFGDTNNWKSLPPPSHTLPFFSNLLSCRTGHPVMWLLFLHPLLGKPFHKVYILYVFTNIYIQCIAGLQERRTTLVLISGGGPHPTSACDPIKIYSTFHYGESHETRILYQHQTRGKNWTCIFVLHVYLFWLFYIAILQIVFEFEATELKRLVKKLYKIL